MTAYALTLEFPLKAPNSQLDTESGVLRIRRNDGSEIVRYIDRPHRRGFTVEGPDTRGSYLVRYAASGDELNSTGQTSVEFDVHDRDGRRISQTRVLDTP